MEKVVKEDIIEVLKSAHTLVSCDNPDPSKLKNLSNQTLRNASIFQDEDSISIAVLIYSLSKVIERVKGNLDCSKIKNLLLLSQEYIEADNIEHYQIFIKKIFAIISKVDVQFKHYIQEVINQASIKKGSNMYDKGISASKTAEILGISLWELYDYIGATSIPDYESDISSLRKRLIFTRRLFK